MVGGGAVGASTAYHLAKIGAGAGVLLLEVNFEEGNDVEKDKVKDNTWLRFGLVLLEVNFEEAFKVELSKWP